MDKMMTLPLLPDRKLKSDYRYLRERIFNFWTWEFTLFMYDPVLKGEWQKAYADCLTFTEMLAAGLEGKA